MSSITPSISGTPTRVSRRTTTPLLLGGCLMSSPPINWRWWAPNGRSIRMWISMVRSPMAPTNCSCRCSRRRLWRTVCASRQFVMPAEVRRMRRHSSLPPTRRADDRPSGPGADRRAQPQLAAPRNDACIGRRTQLDVLRHSIFSISLLNPLPFGIRTDPGISGQSCTCSAVGQLGIAATQAPSRSAVLLAWRPISVVFTFFVRERRGGCDE